MSVYFAQVGRYIKIGYSRDPFKRAQTITRSGKRPNDVPFAADVTLLGYIPGTRRDELLLHARFDAAWVAGEWFALTPKDVRPLIWDDPRGVDIQRMSAQAVFAMLEHPDLTRDEVAALYGFSVEASPWPPPAGWLDHHHHLPTRDTNDSGGSQGVAHAAMLSGVDRAGGTPAARPVSGIAS